MNGWMTSWTVLLVAGIGLFVIMAIAVMIGGFFDVLAMFRRIDQEHQQAAEGDKTEP